MVLQRGFPLTGINFDSPGATGKNIPRRKARRFFGAPVGISPDGDKLRLPGSDRKKYPPPKGEGYFLVLQRGFPLSGINFDSPGATRKNLPAKRRGDFLVLQRGFEPRTPCLKGIRPPSKNHCESMACAAGTASLPPILPPKARATTDDVRRGLRSITCV